MIITLTDIDGVRFEADMDMVKSLFDRGPHREITFHILGKFKVKETIPEIFKLKEAAKCSTTAKYADI